MIDTTVEANGSIFWRDPALPFIEARSVLDGRKISYAKHWHERFSIGLISQGRCNYVNRTQVAEAGIGTVVLMNPGDVHACNPVRGEPLAYKMLYADAAWLCDTQALSTESGRCLTPFSAIATTHAELYEGLNHLFDTLIDPQIAHLEKQVATVSFMGMLQQRLGSSRSLRRQRAPNLTRAADFIRQNCTRSLKLEELCAEIGISASHLIRAFKEAYGLTPHAYQLNCRIEFCRSQLLAGRSISDVALSAGFSDQAHFQRNFKKFVAVTPGQYRARFQTRPL